MDTKNTHMAKAKKTTWTVTVKFEVAPCWVEDGFDMNERVEEIQQFFEGQLLPYAYSGIETKAVVTVKNS